MAGPHISVEELVGRRGVRPIASAKELIGLEAFESGAGLQEFLTDLSASRRAGTA